LETIAGLPHANTQLTLQPFLVKLQYYLFSISVFRSAWTREPHRVKGPDRRHSRQCYRTLAGGLQYQSLKLLHVLGFNSV